MFPCSMHHLRVGFVFFLRERSSLGMPTCSMHLDLRCMSLCLHPLVPSRHVPLFHASLEVLAVCSCGMLSHCFSPLPPPCLSVSLSPSFPLPPPPPPPLRLGPLLSRLHLLVFGAPHWAPLELCSHLELSLSGWLPCVTSDTGYQMVFVHACALINFQLHSLLVQSLCIEVIVW